MRVIVIGIDTMEETVWFSSEHGEGKAIWDGPSPSVGRDYHVELDVIGSLEWGRDIIRTDEKAEFIGVVDDMGCIVGRLESMEEDGLCTVRVGKDLISLETTGNPIQIGSLVKILTRSLVMTDVAY